MEGNHLALVGVGLVVGGLFLAWRGLARLEGAVAALQRQLEGRLGTLEGRFQGLDGQVSGHLQTISTTVATIGAQVDQMARIAESLRQLEHLLRPPTLRGALGELLLEQILRQVLPAGSYAVQHVLSNNARPDAVVFIPTRDGRRCLPIDAKFPALLETGVEERRPAELVRRLRGHLESVAKYLGCPEVLELAILYLPSEALYHEILSLPEGRALIQEGWERRVLVASPNLLVAYLQMISLGLPPDACREANSHSLTTLLPHPCRMEGKDAHHSQTPSRPLGSLCPDRRPAHLGYRQDESRSRSQTPTLSPQPGPPGADHRRRAAGTLVADGKATVETPNGRRISPHPRPFRSPQHRRHSPAPSGTGSASTPH